MGKKHSRERNEQVQRPGCRNRLNMLEKKETSMAGM